MSESNDAILDEVEALGRTLVVAREAIGQRIYGQEDVIETGVIWGR